MNKADPLNQVLSAREEIETLITELQCEVSFWADRIRLKNGWERKMGVEPARIRMAAMSGDPGVEHDVKRVLEDGTVIIEIGDDISMIDPLHYRVVRWKRTVSEKAD